jgi:hypothetical protein
MVVQPRNDSQHITTARSRQHYRTNSANWDDCRAALTGFALTRNTHLFCSHDPLSAQHALLLRSLHNRLFLFFLAFVAEQALILLSLLRNRHFLLLSLRNRHFFCFRCATGTSFAFAAQHALLLLSLRSMHFYRAHIHAHVLAPSFCHGFNCMTTTSVVGDSRLPASPTTRN